MSVDTGVEFRRVVVDHGSCSRCRRWRHGVKENELADVVTLHGLLPPARLCSRLLPPISAAATTAAAIPTHARAHTDTALAFLDVNLAVVHPTTDDAPL